MQKSTIFAQAECELSWNLYYVLVNGGWKRNVGNALLIINVIDFQFSPNQSHIIYYFSRRTEQ